MRKEMMILGVLMITACQSQSSSQGLNVNVATSIANLTTSSTEYDVISILGVPQSVNNGNYIYTDSSNNSYTINISYNSTFEQLWIDKSMISTGGVPYSFNDLQNYVDQEIIALSNHGGDIYDPTSWGTTGSFGVAAGYIEQIEAFKLAQGSNISHIMEIVENGNVVLN
jgi:hypothetical protein